MCVCVRQQFVFWRNFGFPYTKRSDPSSYSPGISRNISRKEQERGVPFAHKLVLCGGDGAEMTQMKSGPGGCGPIRSGVLIQYIQT